jgi:hypothetical protein
MAISCDINVDNSAPGHGSIIIVTYSVDGNDPIDPQGATISGRVVVGSVGYDVSTQVTLPGTPAASVSYEVPECDDLSFVATSDPAVFTATIP